MARVRNRTFKHSNKAFLCFEQGRTQISGNGNCKAHVKNVNPLKEIYSYLQV